MPRYIGNGAQLGECQRCGEKGLARDLVRDGRNPGLLVFIDCYDPIHPQEEPFMVSDSDGMAKNEIAPENLPSTPPVLTSELLAGPVAIGLSWTLADTVGPVLDTYRLYRAEDDGDFDPIASFSVDFGNGIEDLPVVTQAYTDEDVELGTTYTYKIVATAGTAPIVSSSTSNTVDETTPDPCVCSLTAGESGTLRGYFSATLSTPGTIGELDQTLVTVTQDTPTTMAGLSLAITELSSDAAGTGFLILELSGTTDDTGVTIPMVESITIHDCDADTDTVFDKDDPEVFDPDGGTGTSDRDPAQAFRLYKWSIGADVFEDGKCYTLTLVLIPEN